MSKIERKEESCESETNIFIIKIQSLKLLKTYTGVQKLLKCDDCFHKKTCAHAEYSIFIIH